MDIRSVTSPEFESVYAILYGNAQWLLSKNILQWPLEWLESIRPAIESSIDLGFFSAIDINDQMAAVLEIRSAPEPLWQHDLAEALYIHKLAVDRKYSNREVGRKIIEALKTKAILDGKRYVRLDCVAHNNGLRTYYESCGFKLKDIVKTPVVDLALYEYAIQNGNAECIC